MEDRIIKLETKLSYQDHTIEQLNEVVTKQQSQIDRLEIDIKRLHEHLKNNSNSQIAHQEEEIPPPHY